MKELDDLNAGIAYLRKAGVESKIAADPFHHAWRISVWYAAVPDRVSEHMVAAIEVVADARFDDADASLAWHLLQGLKKAMAKFRMEDLGESRDEDDEWVLRRLGIEP